MKLVPKGTPEKTGSEFATIGLSRRQYEMLRSLSGDLHPDTPMAFGAGHAVRKLLERLEEQGIDLSDAQSEKDVARLGAAALRSRTKPRRRR